MSNPRARLDSSNLTIGLIPSGGSASRMPSLPCSKAILPVGKDFSPAGMPVMHVACSSLLAAFELAGIEKVYWVLRDGKWDIPAYLGDGSDYGLSIGYLVTRTHQGVPFTLQVANPFIDAANVAFGLPDVVFRPRDAFVRLMSSQLETGAALTLGLFSVNHPESADVVESDEKGEVSRIYVKPAATDLEYAWFMAVWTADFTRFMRDYVEGIKQRELKVENTHNLTSNKETHIGEVFQAAVDEGWNVRAVKFPDGACIDVGTMTGWTEAVGSELAQWESERTERKMRSRHGNRR